MEKQLAFFTACDYGNLSVIDSLLADESVDPTADNNYALCFASDNGNADVVELLLGDARVDPAADENYVIRCASMNNHSSVVELLLGDSRVNPATNDNEAIRWASRTGYLSVVELLLCDARVNPAAGNNYAIRWAYRNGNSSVVESLLMWYAKNKLPIDSMYLGKDSVKNRLMKLGIWKFINSRYNPQLDVGWYALRDYIQNFNDNLIRCLPLEIPDDVNRIIAEYITGIQ